MCAIHAFFRRALFMLLGMILVEGRICVLAFFKLRGNRGSAILRTHSVAGSRKAAKSQCEYHEGKQEFHDYKFSICKNSLQVSIIRGMCLYCGFGGRFAYLTIIDRQ